MFSQHRHWPLIQINVQVKHVQMPSFFIDSSFIQGRNTLWMENQSIEGHNALTHSDLVAP